MSFSGDETLSRSRSPIRKVLRRRRSASDRRPRGSHRLRRSCRDIRLEVVCLLVVMTELMMDSHKVSYFGAHLNAQVILITMFLARRDRRLPRSTGLVNIECCQKVSGRGRNPE